MSRLLPPVSRRRLLNIALLLVIASTLLGTLALVFGTVTAERQQREQVTQTNAVLFHLRQIYSTALNGETGQRGYLLTLDRRYLEPYRTARARYGDAVEQTQAAIGSDATPRQRELLEEVAALSQAKFAELEGTVRLIDERRLIDARRRVLTDEGLDAMTRLRRAVGELERIELAILRRAIADADGAEARLLPLLGLLLAGLVAALLLGYRLIVRTAQAETEAEGAAALKVERDRADLLAHELNHRVKNLFAVVLAIIQMSGRDAAPEAKPVVTRIAERVRALLTAHEVTQGAGGRDAATLGKLIETALAPYRSDALAARVEGPEVKLAEEHATPLGLVLHEMTTNAVKYGAWAHGGRIDVTWEVVNGTVQLRWRENGVPNGQRGSGEPGREGFGTLLMRSSAKQLGGTVERRFAEDGVEVDISFPLEVGSPS